MPNIDSIMDIIYEYQEQNGIVDNKTGATLKELYDIQEKKQEEIKGLLSQYISDENKVNFILDSIEEYKDEIRKETSCLNERYFKVGFVSAMKLLAECKGI